MSSPTTSDDEYEYEEPKQSHTKKRNPPSEPRKLMRWNPDTDQLVLLCVDAVCTRLNIALPWDEIAKEVAPFLTGEGVKQHLGKIRLAREGGGRKVPPKPDRGTRKKTQAKIKGEDDDEETAAATQAEQAKTANKLTGLLYHGPETQPKKVRTPKKAKEPATPGTGNSTGAGRKRAKSTLDREKLLGTPTKSTTGKRSRKSRVEAVKEEEEDGDYQEGTPTKKARSYSLRAIDKEPDYTKETSIGDDDEEEEEALLTAKDNDGEDSDDEYREDGTGEEERMAEAEVQSEASLKKAKSTTKMPPPPTFSAGRELMKMHPEMFEKSQNAASQASGMQANPLQSPTGYDFADNGAQVGSPGGQDPFFNSATPRTVPAIDFPGMIPRPDESALRSSLNRTPLGVKNESSSSNSGSEKRPSIARKNSKQPIPQTPVKKKGSATANQMSTPAQQIATTPVIMSAPNRKPFITASPFDKQPVDMQAAIDNENDWMDDMGAGNYTSAIPTLPITNDMLYQHMGANGGGMGYGNNSYLHGMGLPNLNLATNADAAVFGGLDILPSPEQYNMNSNAFQLAPIYGNNNSYQSANGMSGLGGMGGMNGLGNMPNMNISGAMNNNYQIGNFRALPTPNHTDSFSSNVTSVMASQTEEANDSMHFDGNNDSPFFGEAMDLKEHEDHDHLRDEAVGSAI